MFFKDSQAANQHLINTIGLLCPPARFHLPSEWNGDYGLVKTESVDNLCLVISTSTGLSQAKKD